MRLKDEELKTEKLVVLGDAKVGKTSLMRRWVNDIFIESYSETISVEFFIKRVKTPSLAVRAWDLSGNSLFWSLTQKYIPDAKFAFILWDSTNVETFKSVRTYLKDLKKYTQNIPIIFIRTKADIGLKDEDWNDEKEEINKLAEEFGIENFSILNTSAKTGLNCDDKAIIPKIHKLLRAQAGIAPVLAASDNRLAYEPSRFTHSRKIRFSYLDEIFAGKNPKDLSMPDVSWLLAHFTSIEDRKSKTSLWIEKQIAAKVGAYDPNVETYDNSHKEEFEKIMGNLLKPGIPFFRPSYLPNKSSLRKIFSGNIPVSKGVWAHLNAVQELLGLLSKRETSFKYKCTFFESSLAIVHQEMKLILDIAKRMHDIAFNKAKPSQEEGHHDNNAAFFSWRELFLKDILADKLISPEIDTILFKWSSELNVSVPVDDIQGGLEPSARNTL